jgi:hypothetical protein
VIPVSIDWSDQYAQDISTFASDSSARSKHGSSEQKRGGRVAQRPVRRPITEIGLMSSAGQPSQAWRTGIEARARVTCLAPGKTPRRMRWYTPEGKAGIVAQQRQTARIEPADVAALTMLLASDDARMCTGHEYRIDAGWR